MRRWVFTIFAGVSLVLSVGMTALWVRSYFRGDCVGVNTSRHPPAVREWFVRSNYGVLYFARNCFPSIDHEPLPLHWHSHAASRSFSGPVFQSRPHHFRLGPFSLGGGGNWSKHDGFTIPHWFLAALNAIPPGFWLHRWRRRRRAARRCRLGLCPACGYDLRASVGRCPECGEPQGLQSVGVDEGKVIGGA